MPLSVGQNAPDFKLLNQQGEIVSLSSQLVESEVVLLFYPKDFTQGCTAELCSFRDEIGFFIERGIQVFGISHDSVNSHKSFAQKEKLSFPLLSDPGRGISKLYKAVYPLAVLTRRVSYFIGQNDQVLFAYEAMLDSQAHLFKIKQFILSREKVEKTSNQGLLTKE